MKLLICILFIFFLVIAVVILISIYENRHFIVKEYQVAGAKVPEAFSGFRIAVITDLHNQQFGEKNVQLLKAVKAQKPDIVICAGDLLVGKPDVDFTAAVNLVTELAKLYPVYMAMGNHEYRLKLYPETYGDMWQRYYEKTKLPGVIWLDNETVYLDRNTEKIGLTGLSMDAIYYRRLKKTAMPKDYLVQCCPFPDRAIFQILLAHNPDYFPEYAAYGADLVISGHVHGGMVRLPLLGGCISPMLKLFPRYDRGAFHHGNRIMLLSAGLGNHTIKLRVNNPPELMMIELQKDTKSLHVTA